VKKHIETHSPNKFVWMQQSEFGADERLAGLIQGIDYEITPHCNFISTAQEFEKLHTSAESRVTMDRFYRKMRLKTKLLLDAHNQPEGGSWNYDKDNREPPGKKLETKPIRTFPPDDITQSVIEMVDRHFPDHPGDTNNWIYAVTREDALLAAEDFFENRLDQFGPHQDAMIIGEPFLNHSILSPYINICLLHPLELCKEAERRYRNEQARLSSVEGFVRQVIGWREFIWRVYWRMMPEYKKRNTLDARESLPEFFWTGDTSMRCLNEAVGTTIKYAYSHHIMRLMILGNFALIAGLDPLETNDWFASMYIDGYDWVMVPNVIGMTLHADGGYVGTKPYAASANYIKKMSNYCKKCSFNSETSTEENSCPFNALYWDFLIRNQDRFAKNARMGMMMRNLASKSDQWRHDIIVRAEKLRNSGFR
ncbi:MAG: cryptochrome/photolyase family protein, partial [Cyanobacteria bacterium]|nr:cryptochrome/photolyase family protein [Cyanobacteriota bacterium]